MLSTGLCSPLVEEVTAKRRQQLRSLCVDELCFFLRPSLRMFSLLTICVLAPLALAPFVVFLTRLRFLRLRRVRQHSARASGPTIAFLHPECLSGGGGERVLWVSLAAVQAALPEARLLVCAPWPDLSQRKRARGGSDDFAARSSCRVVAEAKKRVSAQFHLSVPDFEPVPVRCAWLVDPALYPRLTMVLQACGAIVLGLEAYLACGADVFVDSANMAFALMPAKVLGATTVTYTHYPTISSDMLGVVRERKNQFNNNGVIARSKFLSSAKLVYYRAFARFYALAGRAADVVMVNSSWTRGHLAEVWGERRNGFLETVFPPCDTSLLSSLSLDGPSRRRGLIISIGQFRPEKNHMLQLEVMHKLVSLPEFQLKHMPKLIMVGGARHKADAARIEALRAERSRLGLEGVVEMRVNASWDELFELLSMAEAGLHTMRDEHFGISIVELQAAGVVPVAHRSGGVAMDIVEDNATGFLADDASEYARRLYQALGGSSERAGSGAPEPSTMKREARKRTSRFSDAEFAKKFGSIVARVAKEGCIL